MQSKKGGWIRQPLSWVDRKPAMHKHQIPILFLFLILFSLGCKTATLGTTSGKPLPDGLYPVLHTHEKLPRANQVEGTIIPFSTHFMETYGEDDPPYLEIDASDFSPLTLAAPPDSVTQKDKRIRLMLQLTDEAGQSLADFTGKHMMEHVAIVIGGQAITMHRVKARIEGGKLQITRCTDNACEYLYMELKDNLNPD